MRENQESYKDLYYIKWASKAQHVKMSDAFRKIYLHNQAPYEINDVTEFTNVTKLRIKN